MSLIKQLWIAIATVTLLAFGGSMMVSTLNARQYLQQQLNIKNSDNATVLALALTSLLRDTGSRKTGDAEGDAEEADDLEGIAVTMLESQFKTGYYRQIHLVAPDGKVIADFHADTRIERVPAWFVKLASIKAHPGVAHVNKSNGWRQFGTLTLESHTSYVYESLWSNTLQLLGWFLITSVVAGLFGSILLGRITAPLRTLVMHAQAIGERRFITSPEPRTTELKVVVRAMNALSDRVRQMLAEEAQRLENLRRQIHEDAVTGLLERRQFLNAFSSRLADPKASAQGALLILRFGKLADLNRDLGRVAADKLLNALAKALDSDPDCIGGRLNGSDLALLAPSVAGFEFSSWAASVAERVYAIANEQANADMLTLAIAAVPYSRSEAMTAILARLDTALVQAELESRRGLKIEEHRDDTSPARTQEQWREILTTALSENTFQPNYCPVCSVDGSLIHNEEVFDLPEGDAVLKTGDFLPWAARLGLIGRMDYAAVQTAIERIESGKESVAVTISAQTFQDGRFVTRLIALLRASPELVERLWMEVPEEDAVRNPAAFHAFCLAVKPFASKVGIKHAGPHFSALGDLHDLGLDYLKVDTSLLRDIDQNEGNQSFVRSLVMLAHTLGFVVIAEGIDRPEQRTILADLGFDGLAGPLLTD
ncbi:MAG: EAL domain-containing protein [Betaproteobacteria bacterium]|nr:EAL domain-containing protein [Betaproteobacteria bacterium]